MLSRFLAWCGGSPPNGAAERMHPHQRSPAVLTETRGARRGQPRAAPSLDTVGTRLPAHSSPTNYRLGSARGVSEEGTSNLGLSTTYGARQSPALSASPRGCEAVSHEPPLLAAWGWASGTRGRGCRWVMAQQAPRSGNDSMAQTPAQPSALLFTVPQTTQPTQHRATKCWLLSSTGDREPPLPQPPLACRPVGPGPPTVPGQGPVPRLLHPFPPPLLSSKQSGRAETAHDVKSRKPPWSLPSPISTQFSRCDRGQGCSTLLSRGSRPLSQAPGSPGVAGQPNPGGHPSTPTTTKSLICISNASQMSHFFSFQLLPLKTISLNGAEILGFKTAHLPTLSEAPEFSITPGSFHLGPAWLQATTAASPLLAHSAKSLPSIKSTLTYSSVHSSDLAEDFASFQGG